MKIAEIPDCHMCMTLPMLMLCLYMHILQIQINSLLLPQDVQLVSMAASANSCVDSVKAAARATGWLVSVLMAVIQGGQHFTVTTVRVV